MNPLPHSLSATIESIQGDTVTLVLSDGQRLSWPAHKLASKDLGDTVQLIALTDDDSEAERAELAKHVLNFMLSGESP